MRDLGVKQAPFVVLIGAAMPSVLAEISFVTNPQEARLLKSSAYRQRIAEALFSAVQQIPDVIEAASQAVGVSVAVGSVTRPRSRPRTARRRKSRAGDERCEHDHAGEAERVEEDVRQAGRDRLFGSIEPDDDGRGLDHASF